MAFTINRKWNDLTRQFSIVALLLVLYVSPNVVSADIGHTNIDTHIDIHDVTGADTETVAFYIQGLNGTTTASTTLTLSYDVTGGGFISYTPTIQCLSAPYDSDTYTVPSSDPNFQFQIQFDNLNTFSGHSGTISTDIKSVNIGDYISDTDYCYVVINPAFSTVSTQLDVDSSTESYNYYSIVSTTTGTGVVNLNGSNSMYFQLTDLSREYTIPPYDPFDATSLFNIPYDTRFLDLTVTASTGTPSTHYHFDVSVQYYFDTSEYDPDDPRFNAHLIHLTTVDDTGTALIDQYISINTATNGTSTVLHLGGGDEDFAPNTNYYVIARYANLENITDSEALYPFEKARISQQVSVSSVGVVSEGTTLNLQWTAPDYSKYEDCGIRDISACINNSFKFLFVPSSEAIQPFTELNDDLSTKFPFAYAYDMKDTFTALYDNPNSTTTPTISVPFGSFGNITLLSEDMINDVPYTSFFRGTIEALLYIMFAINIYRRTLTVFNRTPSS